jgi:DNA-binding NarL/FixJ family response regulator
VRSAAEGGALLERGRELATLRRLVRSASEGAGAAVLITGDAGIGKTALVAAGCAEASNAGLSVLSARAGELESEFAWGVVRQLFAGAVSDAREDRSGWFSGAAALARPALGVESAASAVDASYATLHGLYWLTVNLAQRGPLLLAVDDLHWADPPSVRFLAHLVARIAELPVLLLVASRPVSSDAAPGAAGLVRRIAGDPTLTVVHPPALGASACAALVRDALTREATDEFCLACQEVSGGNPFLLRSLLADLAAEPVAPGAASVEHVRRMTPAAVSASVLLRLAQLPRSALDLARAVAILGGPAELRPARLLAGLDVDQATDAAGALIRAGILRGEKTIGYVHPLARTAVYRDLAGPERGRWHHRAARLLADEHVPLERIALHLIESLPDADAWTVGQLRAAAADASARGAPEIAADYLRRALAEPPKDKLRAAVLFELGVAEAKHDPAAAVPHLAEALARADDSAARTMIAVALGDALTLAGQLAEAVQVLQRGIAEAGDDAPVRASLEAALLSAARWEPAAQDARHQLVADVQRRAHHGAPLDPRLHCQLAIETSARGVDREAAVGHARAALVAADEPPAAGATTMPEAMLVLVFADHADAARTRIDTWLALARSHVWPLGVSVGSTCASLAALYRGSVGEAVAHARGAVAGDAEIRLAPITVAFLVEALIERGELDLASSELAERGLDGELPLAWATTPLLLARGRLHAAAGDHRAAIRDLLATGQRCAAWQVANPAMVPWRSSAALSLARLGDRDRAIALADEEVELARGWGAQRAIGVAVRAAGMVRDGEQGIELLRQAAEILESSPAPLEHARALTELGAALRRAGQRSQARQQLRSALDLAHRLGGIAVANRAREELTIAGARPRRAATRGRDALTPSELRVAQLAAAGRTNREIAESLFLTLRTVETHLTSSYTKLGITSRRQLAARLDAAAD